MNQNGNADNDGTDANKKVRYRFTADMIFEGESLGEVIQNISEFVRLGDPMHPTSRDLRTLGYVRGQCDYERTDD